MTIKDYEGLAPSQRMTMALMTFMPCKRNVAALLMFLRGRFKTATRSSVEGLAKDLEKRGFLAVDHANRYRLGCLVDRDVLVSMAEEAEAEGWWPDKELVLSSMRKDPDNRYVGENYLERTADLSCLEARGVGLLARGGAIAKDDPFVKALSLPGGLNLARATAFAWVDACVELPSLDLAGATRPLFLRQVKYLLSAAFMMMRDVRPMLRSVDAALRAGAKARQDLQRLFAALCVWTGWREGLANEALDKADPVVFGFRAAMKGEFAVADKMFKGDLDERSGDPEETDLDTFCERLLMGMVCAVAKPDKIAKTRPAQLFRGGLRDSYYGGGGCDVVYRHLAHEYSFFFANWWKTILAGKGDVILRGKSTLPTQGPIVALVYAWDWRMMTGGRSSSAEIVPVIHRKAHDAERAGYLNLAGLILTLIHGGYDKAAEDGFAAGVIENCLRFLPLVEPEPDWKGMVRELRATVAKAAKSGKRKEEAVAHERLIWTVSLSNDRADAAEYEVEEIQAAIRPNGAPADGSEDELFDDYRLGGKRIQKLMNERDKLIASTLMTDSYYRGGRAEDAVLPLLCGIDNLERRDRYVDRRSYYEERLRPAHPIRIEKRTCEMESSIGEDGGLVLKLPDWVIGSSDDEQVLRKIDSDTFAYVEISRDVKRIADAFSRFGSGGKIILPREAMEEAEDVVEGLTALIPVAEPTGDALENLRRVPAASDCRVRLDFDTGVLAVRVVVLPVPENAAMTFDPGLGQREKLVNSVAGAYVLVRDLEAEKAAFRRIKAALAESENWFDGKSAWTFDDLAAGIGALAALKALDPAVPLEWMKERKLSVTAAPASKVALVSRRTADDWFRVEGNFTLDDGRVLSVVEMLEAARDRVGDYVRLSDGDYVKLSRAMTKELDALGAASRRKGDGLEIVKAAVPMLDGVFGEGEDALELPDAMAKTADEIREAFRRKSEPPNTLNAELRPYQTDGYRWLSQLAACGFGACLADDMGLGKTLQVIALLLERAKGGPSLVVAPSSVCGNWRNEINRFAPTLRPIMAWEALEGRPADKEAAALASIEGAGVVVIASYGYLLFHEEAFTSFAWNGLVLDEAQAIKNDASRRAKTVKRFSAKFRVAATGTPVENRLGELWSLFDFLNPGLLGPAASFAQRFTVDGKASSELKRLVRPLILRRLKGDVLDDLPEKTEVTVPVTLGTDERTAYEGCRRHALAVLEQRAAADGEANRMSILAELTRLRRFCCHPSLVLPDSSVRSAKMDALVELLDSLHQGHHRALVFSQFTDYLAIVRKVVESHGWTHLYLDGSTPTAERERLVNAFQGGEGDFFLISLKAGGTGLNLTAANYVILLDPWWNPAVENQAADRAHRIGQKNPVTVYRLIASDTVEERVIELHREKREMATDILGGTGSAALSPETLMKLFG